VSARKDTIRAWRLGLDGTEGRPEWVDALGRVVLRETADGLTIRRMAFELSFENWRRASRGVAGDQANEGSISERTLISAGIAPPAGRLSEVRLRLTAPLLRGLDLDGGRQSFQGGVLTVSSDRATALEPKYVLPPDAAHRSRFRAELAAEPSLQSEAALIVRRAVQVAGLERDPRVIAGKLADWVHTHVAKVPSLSDPDALAVLRTLRGDCNEHAQLYVALARAIGIPARVVAGVMLVNGRFHYHVWAEVFLGDWVAVDPTFGQFPADASRIRLVAGGSSRRPELLRLLETLNIEVLEAR